MSDLVVASPACDAVPVYPSLLAKVLCSLSASEARLGLSFPDEHKGAVLQTQNNIMFFNERFEVSLGYDEFTGKYHVFNVPQHTYLDDAAFDDIFAAMDRVGLRCTKDYLWSILRSLARNLRVHPVRQMLANLQTKWDGIRRIDTWLPNYCGADDTPFVRAAGANWLIAAVRRIRQPGCKFDHILILEGPQGVGKSTVFRYLSYDTWFTDNVTIGLDPKEVIELTRGKWIAELAELTNIGKKEVEAIKAFITRQVDEARMAYARETIAWHRQFVLGATTNRARYLRDESGDRRFWTVEVKGHAKANDPQGPLMIDLDGLGRDRDQLWAEAAVREAEGVPLHLPPEIEVLARVEQAKRYDADERQQRLEDLLEGLEGFVPNDELYHAIGITKLEDRHPGVSKLLTGAMARLSWKPDRVRCGGKQHRGWASSVEMTLSWSTAMVPVSFGRQHVNSISRGRDSSPASATVVGPLESRDASRRAETEDVTGIMPIILGF